MNGLGAFAGGLAGGMQLGWKWKDRDEEEELKKAVGDAYTQGQGLGARDPSEYRQYEAQFRDTNPEAADAYARAAEANAPVPTASERRRAGIGSMADTYAARGYADKANALYDQSDQMLDREETRADRGLARARSAELHPLQVRAATTTADKADLELDEAKVTRDLMTVVRKGKPAIIDFYRKQVPDDWDVEERPMKGGGFELIQVKDEGGKRTIGQSLGQFKDDDDLAMGVLMNAPKLVLDIIKTRMTHENRMAEIAAQQHASMAVAGIYAGARGRSSGSNRLEGQKAVLEVPTGDVVNGQPQFRKVQAYHDGTGWKSILGNKPIDEATARYPEGAPSRGLSLKDMKEAEELLRLRNPDFDTLPLKIQEDMRAGLLGQPTALEKLVAVKGGSKEGSGTSPTGLGPAPVVPRSANDMQAAAARFQLEKLNRSRVSRGLPPLTELPQ